MEYMGPKTRIYCSVIVIAVTCGIVAWFLSGVRTSFTWDAVMDALQVHNRERYTRLAVLGVLAITIVALLRLFRSED